MLICYFTKRPRLLLLIDGAGALVTALLLWLIPLALDFGLPEKVTSVLSFTAIGLAVYSFSCAGLVKTNYRPFLAGIALANLLYCVAIAILMALHYSQISVFGILYFSIEIVVISILVVTEVRVAHRVNP